MDSIKLSFDWHHDQGYTIRKDKVIVQYSFDNKEWFSVKEFRRYDDTKSGWDRKEILMPDSVSDQSEIYFGFLFHSEYGNNCHLDSIVISATPIEEPYPEFIAEPRIGVIDSIVVFTDKSLNGPSSWEWNFGGGATPFSITGQGPHEVTYSNTGLKTIALVLDGQYLRVKHNYIIIESTPFHAPRNLTANVDENDVYLEWEMAQSIFGSEKSSIIDPLTGAGKATLTDFVIFRDSIAIDTISENAYADTSLLPGIYAYYVVANYTTPEGISDPSNTVYADVPVIIVPLLKDIEIKVYPNPSTGQLFIDVTKKCQLIIYNNYGAKVQELLIDKPGNSIDLSKHPPGLYILQFNHDEGIYPAKILIQ
jgi:PKD repeat protein